MKTFLASLVVLFSISNISFAQTSGEHRMVTFACKKAVYAKSVARAIVETDDEDKVSQIANALIKEGRCTKLPMPAEVILVKVADRVKGTNGRRDLLVWEIKNATGHTWYSISLDEGANG